MIRRMTIVKKMISNKTDSYYFIASKENWLNLSLFTVKLHRRNFVEVFETNTAYLESQAINLLYILNFGPIVLHYFGFTIANSTYSITITIHPKLNAIPFFLRYFSCFPGDDWRFNC